MPESTAPDYSVYISCEMCLKSIPSSDSKCLEAEDYVAHFCGLECYDIWVKQQKRQNKSELESDQIA